VLIALTALAIIFMPEVIRLLAPGFSDEPAKI
jgi:peptidoglycan biosynthesis protein MviN/MurJ (putative lipid II flippase)